MSKVLVGKFGRNFDVDAATSPEDLIEEGGEQYWAAAAAILQVTSSLAADAAAGTGMRTMRIYGVDGDYREIVEDVTMNGLTIVNTVQEFLRVNRAHLLQVGSGLVNAGNISIGDGTGVLAYVAAGAGQTQKAAYTIPAGYQKLRIKNIKSNLFATGVQGEWVDVRLLTREDGSGWRERWNSGSGDSFYYDSDTDGVGVSEKTDVVLKAANASADNLSVNGAFTIVYD
jgi:hypothetical protein